MALKDKLVKELPENYTPLDSSPASRPVQPPTPGMNMRTALPPTTADADLLRQGERGTAAPQFRIMPLLPQTGGSVTVKTGGSTTASSSSSGGSSSASVAKTISATVNIPGNGAVLLRLTASRSFQLFSIAAGLPCCIRLYGNAGAQSVDNSRSIDSPVPAELTQNIIVDVVFDTAPYFWNTQNIVGVNADAPQSTNLYVTVINPTSVPISNMRVSITFVPIEP